MREGAVYTTIRNLDINESMTFPYEKWNACRSACTAIGRLFDCHYTTSKTGKPGVPGDIVVTRTE